MDLSANAWPADVAARIQTFLRERRTGQIVLNVNAGTVTGGSFHETWRRTKPAPLDNLPGGDPILK